jgi:hypothetical protein
MTDKPVIIDLAAQPAAIVDELEAALETDTTSSTRPRWTEQFTASGKQGKGID